MPEGPGTGLLSTILLRKVQTLLEVDTENSTGRPGQQEGPAPGLPEPPPEGPMPGSGYQGSPGTPESQCLLLLCVQKTRSWQWRPPPYPCPCPPGAPSRKPTADPLPPPSQEAEAWKAESSPLLNPV